MGGPRLRGRSDGDSVSAAGSNGGVAGCSGGEAATAARRRDERFDDACDGGSP